MDENNISVEEVMKITHKSREFIINAIQQVCFPGSVAISGTRRNMNKFSRSPSEQLIIALLNSLNEKSTRHQKTSAQHANKL